MIVQGLRHGLEHGLHLDGVVLRADQEAGGQLRARRAGVEQRRARVREPGGVRRGRVSSASLTKHASEPRSVGSGGVPSDSQDGNETRSRPDRRRARHEWKCQDRGCSARTAHGGSRWRRRLWLRALVDLELQRTRERCLQAQRPGEGGREKGNGKKQEGGAPALGEEVVGLDGGVQVVLVDADGDAHQHVLGALHHLPVDLQQVRALQCLRPAGHFRFQTSFG